MNGPDVDPLLKGGIEKFNQGRYPASIAEFSEAIARDPRNPNAYFFRSIACRAAGDKGAAGRDIVRVLCLDPDSPLMRVQTGRLLKEVEGGQALMRCREAIQRAPRSSLAYEVRSDIEAAAGFPDRAWRSLQRAIALDARSVDVHVKAAQILKTLGRNAEASKWWAAAARLSRDPASVHEARSDSELASGERRAAWRSLQRAIALAPAAANLRLKAAALLRSLGESAAALRQCRAAIRSDPADPNAHLVRADLEWAQGRGDLARASIAGALALDPGSVPLLLKAAVLFKTLEENPRALQACEAAVRLDPASSYARLVLADIEWSLGSRHNARAALEAALSLDRRSVVNRIWAYELHKEMGDYETAFDCLKQAVRLDPDNVAAVAKLAEAHLWRGEYALAVRHAEKALALDPLCAGAFRTRGAAAVCRGRCERALPDLDRALELAPEDTEAFAWRGEAGRRLGRPSAWQDLVKARLRCPFHLGALINQELILQARGESLPMADRSFIQTNVPKEIADLKKDLSLPQPTQAAASLERTLERMKGNRSAKTTFLAGPRGRERVVEHLHYFPRDPLVSLQAKLRFGSVDRVLGELDRLVKETPDEAYLYSHRAEVYLWVGRYQDAERDFRRARRLNPVLLWPKVGLAGVRLMVGDLKKGLALIEFAAKHGGSESIVLTWRGEIYRKLGKFKRALEEFEKIPEVPPFRPAGWINLALTKGALGDRAGQRRIFLALRRHMPEFMADAAAESGAARGGAWPDPAIRKVLEKGLQMMRGNRSRWMYTYFTRDGRLKLSRIRAVRAQDVPPQLVGNRWAFHNQIEPRKQ